MMETVKAWALVIFCGLVAVLVAEVVVFYSIPVHLDHWDKARAQTRIEVKNMEADADMQRDKRLQAGITVR